MYNGNGRPLNKKKQVQLMVVLTILAWATQTLRHQWGFGADVQPASNDSKSDSADDGSTGTETFVPAAARFANGATLEMRSEATIVGAEIKLKQLCRWSDDDKPVFAPVADFVIARFVNGVAFKSVSIADLKSTLHDAGINLATINIVGATACTISRSDAHYDEQTALQQWIDAREGAASPTTQPGPIAEVPTTTQPSQWADGAAQGVNVSQAIPAAAVIPASSAEEKPYHTLRELLNADLATRLSVPAEQIQMSFRAEDERVLNLSEPTFRFEIEPQHVRDLGSVSWNVTVLSSGEKRRITINAEGRAWQQQMVLVRPVDSRQVIQPTDFVERRTLVSSLPSDPLLTRDQLGNEQASQSLKPGTVMTARMVDSVPLAKAGQLVTVTVEQGSVQIKTVARAMEGGSFGQVIRVKNETTRDIYDVTLTGPQEGTMSSTGGASGGASSAASGQ